MKRLTVLIACLFFAGCTPNIAWVKPGAGADDLRLAQEDCARQSQKPAGILARATLRDRRFVECMKGKGFHQVTGESPAVTRKAAEKKIEKLEETVESVIDRHWQEGDTAYVLVTVKNSTKDVLERVRVRCLAIGPDGNRINIGEEIVSHPDHDFKKSLRPGQSRTVRVSIKLNGGKMQTPRCTTDW